MKNHNGECFLAAGKETGCQIIGRNRMHKIRWRIIIFHIKHLV
jgi:hypothetical protein